MRVRQVSVVSWCPVSDDVDIYCVETQQYSYLACSLRNTGCDVCYLRKLMVAFLGIMLTDKLMQISLLSLVNTFRTSVTRNIFKSQ
jgi:hypothetical protein